MHLPDSEVAFIKEIISLLLWDQTEVEPTSDHVVWGEATLSTQSPTLFLTRKGVVRRVLGGHHTRMGIMDRRLLPTRQTSMAEPVSVDSTGVRVVCPHNPRLDN